MEILIELLGIQIVGEFLVFLSSSETFVSGKWRRAEPQEVSPKRYELERQTEKSLLLIKD
jgi:hypothetical protein